MRAAFNLFSSPVRLRVSPLMEADKRRRIDTIVRMQCNGEFVLRSTDEGVTLGGVEFDVWDHFNKVTGAMIHIMKGRLPDICVAPESWTRDNIDLRVVGMGTLQLTVASSLAEANASVTCTNKSDDDVRPTQWDGRISEHRALVRVAIPAHHHRKEGQMALDLVLRDDEGNMLARSWPMMQFVIHMGTVPNEAPVILQVIPHCAHTNECVYIRGRNLTRLTRVAFDSGTTDCPVFAHDDGGVAFTVPAGTGKTDVRVYNGNVYDQYACLFDRRGPCA